MDMALAQGHWGPWTDPRLSGRPDSPHPLPSLPLSPRTQGLGAGALGEDVRGPWGGREEAV